MTKRLKNISGSTSIWMGQEIINLAYHTVERDEIHRWQMDDKVQSDITAGNLLYNDGTTDYTDPTDGLAAWLADDGGLIVGVLVNDAAKADGKVLAYNNTTKKIEYQSKGGGGGVFGSEFQHSEDETLSSTNTTYTEKLTWTTTSLPAGDYKIEWSINLGNTSKDAGSWVRVQLDDTTDLIETTKGKASQNNYFVPIAGFQIVTLTAATHQIDVDFRADSGTAEIKNVRLLLYRVA